MKCIEDVKINYDVLNGEFILCKKNEFMLIVYLEWIKLFFILERIDFIRDLLSWKLKKVIFIFKE